MAGRIAIKLSIFIKYQYPDLKHESSINAYAKTVLLSVTMLFVLQGIAQNRGIDSTLIFLEKHKSDDTLKVKALLYASNIYQTLNLQRAMYFADLAVNIATKINNQYYLALSSSRLGSVYTWYGKTNEALNLYLKETAIAKTLNSDYLLQDAYDGIAYVYETEKEWDQSLQYGLKSLSISETNPSPGNEAYSYHQLGSVYLGMGDYLKAELYLKKAKKIFINSNATERVGICNVDLAKVYINLHYFNLAKIYLDSAIQLFSSVDAQFQIAETYQQLGIMALKQELYDDAEVYFNQVLGLYSGGGYADVDYARAAIGLGEVALGRKDYKKALVVLKDEYEKIKASNDKDEGLQCLLYLAESDSATGNFKEAYDYMQQYRVLNNAIYNEKKSRATQRMLIEFEVERQNNENNILKTKYAEQQDRLIIIVSALCLILVGAFFLILLYRQKNIAFKSVEKLQEETSGKNKELLVTNSVKDKLISMIAHDVRSPLASVQNTLTLTREEVITLEDFARLSQMLEMDIQHLTGMLDNTLMWAREQMIDINIKKASFNLYDIIHEVIALYQQTITSKGVSVHNNIKKNAEVFSDKEIIATVLRNIISNAIKFTPQGKNIYIEQTVLKSKMLISVKDEGVGISDSVLGKINNKEFISTRGTDNEKGTGLGLLFSRDLLIKLGEDFQISSVQGRGTAVTISINTKK